MQPIAWNLRLHVMWQQVLSRMSGRAGDFNYQPARQISVVAITTCVSECDALADIARKAGWKFKSADNCKRALDYLSGESTVVVCDGDLPNVDWRQSVAAVGSATSRCVIVLASRTVNQQLRDDLLYHGGYTIVPKPYREDNVVRIVNFAWTYLKLSALQKDPL